MESCRHRQPMMKLHDPVPGYASDLHESMGLAPRGLGRTEGVVDFREPWRKMDGKIMGKWANRAITQKLWN